MTATALPDDLDLTRAAQEAAQDALAVFIHACRTSDDERVRLDAAKQIRDWAFGRPATQEAPPQSESAPEQAEAEADDEFWASLGDSELMILFLQATRELRGRKLENGMRYYAREFGIPLIAAPHRERPAAEANLQREQPAAERHDQLVLRLEEPAPPPEPELPDPSVTTARSTTPGPGEIAIICPGKLTVPFLGHVFNLRPGLQIVPELLAKHPIVQRFITADAA